MGAGPLPRLTPVPAHARVPARPVDEGAAAAVADPLAAWLAGCQGTAAPVVRARVVAAAPVTVAGAETEVVAGAGDPLLGSDAVAGAETGDRLSGGDPSLGPAFTVSEVAAAVDAGRAAAAGAAADGMTVVAGVGTHGDGELGARCVAAWLGGVPSADARVAAALALHAGEIRGPLGALRRLGAGDLAILCGVALGAGERGLAFVCDGLVPVAAAALAVAIEPGLRPRLLAARPPRDEAEAALLAWLGLTPVADGADGAIAAL